MRILLIVASLGGMAAIKLIPVQRTTRYTSKQSDESSTSTSSSNKVVLDQLHSVKKVLAHAEVMRNELNELVGEFSSAESQRRKVGVYNRAQTLVAGFLSKYDKNDVLKDCTGKEDCIIGSVTSPYSDELREQIRLAFEREGTYYLELMDAVIQNGWAHVLDKVSSPDTSTKIEPTLSASAASFKSKDDVRNVFVYWRERTERLRKSEQPKKKQQSGSFYSVIGLILVATVMAGYVYTSFRNKNGSGVVWGMKASVRRRQLQRRQYVSNVIRSLRHWLTSIKKRGADLMSFSVFIIATLSSYLFDIINLAVKSVMPRKTGGAETMVRKAGSKLVVKRKKTHSKSAVVTPVEDVSGEVQKKRAEPLIRLQTSVQTLVDSKSFDSEWPGETVCGAEAVSSVSDSVTSPELPTEKEDEEEGRGESPTSVLRTSSLEALPNEEDHSVVAVALATSLTPRTTADEEGWTVSSSTISARGRTNRKSHVGSRDAMQHHSRKDKEGNGMHREVNVLPSRTRYTPKHKTNNISVVSDNTPIRDEIPSMPEKSQPVFNSEQKPQSPAPADCTDQESVEDIHQNHDTIKIKDNTSSSDRPVHIDDDVVSDATAVAVAESSPQPLTEDSKNSSPSETREMLPVVPPEASLSPVFVVPPIGSWQTQQGQQFMPMPMNMPYCYPPPPYGMYPGMEGYAMMEHMPPVLSHAGVRLPLPVPVPPQYPAMIPMIDDRMVDAIRRQVEYYFSVENLCRDVYLRHKMDSHGFVLLEEIIQFNRIRHLNAPLSVVLRAVQTSPKLEVLQPWAAKVSAGQVSDRAILDTKIRCAVQWERWILSSTSGNKMEAQP